MSGQHNQKEIEDTDEWIQLQVDKYTKINQDASNITGQKRKRDDEGDESEDIEDTPPPKKKKKTVIIMRNDNVKNWFLTFNNYEREKDRDVKRLLALRHLVAYAIQEEISSTGTPHLQGCLSFDKKRSFEYLHGKFPTIHWESVDNLPAARNYCKKLKTRNGKQWVLGFKTGQWNRPEHYKNVADPMEGKTLYSYQKKVVAICQGPVDSRKIYWYWSAMGNIGKSSLTKHLVLTMGALVIGGTWKDACYAIQISVAKGIQPNIVIFDIPRRQGNKISYPGIECIKNGCFFSPKYESIMCVFDPPHIIIFANSSPDEGGLSEDRWVIENLDADKDLQHLRRKPRNFVRNKFISSTYRRN